MLLLLHTTVTVAANPAPPENEIVQELDEIIVQNIKDPVGLSYREILKALDVYERHRGLAPFAPVRFKVNLNRKQWDASQEPLTLRLVGSNTAIDIPVAAEKPWRKNIFAKTARYTHHRLATKLGRTIL